MRVYCFSRPAALHLCVLAMLSVAGRASGSRVVDRTGTLTAEERSALDRQSAALEKVRGIALGLLVSGATAPQVLQTEVGAARKQMVAAGSLPPLSAVFGASTSGAYAWSYDTRVREKLTWDQLQAAWGATSGTVGARLSALVGKLGGNAAAPPPRPLAPIPDIPGIEAIPVKDEAGRLASQDAFDLVAALKKLKAERDISLGILTCDAPSVAEAQKRAQAVRREMIDDGSLESVSSVFGVTGNQVVWAYDRDVLKTLPVQQLQAAWSASNGQPSLGKRLLAFVEHVRTGQATTPPVTQPQPPVVTPPATPTPPPTTPTAPSMPVPPVEAPGSGILRPVRLPPIALSRGARLAHVAVDARVGGTAATSDGLTVRLPAGSLDKPRTISIYQANVAAPAMAFGFIGQQPEPLQPWRAWDLDAGGQTDLFPGAIEYSLDVKELRQPDGRYPAIQLATSVDGQRWTFLPYEVHGTKLVCRTRHFCPLAAYVGWKYLAALGVTVGAYMYARGWEGLKEDLGTELPSVFADKSGASLPWNWVSLGPDARGFQVWWHVSVAGTSSGLAREAAFNGQKDGLVADYLKALNDHPDWNDQVLTALRRRIESLRWQYLMPQKVKVVNHALRVAADYLESRGFKRPYLTLPVYVVQSVGGDCGRMQNPWLGRRYMVFGANQDANDLYATALHELFHNYQSGYLWYTAERQAHLPVTEASALLLEREAAPHYAKIQTVSGQTGVKIWTDIASMNVYKDGLFGSPPDLGTHGYGLSWFLEYLRDNGYSGATSFHKSFLERWAAASGTLFRALTMGVSTGSGVLPEEWLGRHYLRFAKDAVLTGMTGNTPYGKRYSRPVFKGDPYVDLDFSKQPVQQLTDQMIKPWSIQFYRLLGRGEGKLVVRVPGEWFTYKPPGRGVFMRKEEPDPAPIAWEALNVAKGLSKDAWLVMPFNVKRYLYVVDTGQSGSGWVSDYKPAQAFTLAPPSAVTTALAPGTQAVRVTWRLSPTAEASLVIQRHFVYVPNGNRVLDFIPRLPLQRVGGGGELPVAEVGGKDVSATISLPEPLTVAPDVRVTSAVQVGVDAAGRPVYLESDRSDAQRRGTITGTVNLRKEEIDPKKLEAANPFATLAGFPVSDAPVVVTFTVDGQPHKLYLKTDKNGGFVATVPLGVPVQITARGESKTATCTPDKPQAGVLFGWGGHQVTIDKQVDTRSVPMNLPAP